MKHPKSSDILKVANAFSELANDKNLMLDMANSQIQRLGCNTYTCHAGWYAYSKFMKNPKKKGKFKGNYIR